MSLNLSKKNKGISPSHSYSPRQEAKFAKEYSAIPVSNSGRGQKKGDSVLSIPPPQNRGSGDSQLGEGLQFMIDNKATIHKSYSVTIKILTKLIEQSLSENMLPVLHVELNCDTLQSEEFFVLPKITFDEIMERL